MASGGRDRPPREQRPDPWTHPWLKAQFEGVCHSYNMLAHDVLEIRRMLQSLDRRIAEDQTRLLERLRQKFASIDTQLADLKQQQAADAPKSPRDQ